MKPRQDQSNSEDWSPQKGRLEAGGQAGQDGAGLGAVCRTLPTFGGCVHFEQNDDRWHNQVNGKRYETNRSGTGGTEDRLQNGETENGGSGGRKHERIDDGGSTTQRFEKPEKYPRDQKEPGVRKNQCQDEAALLQKKLARDLGHADKERCWQGEREGELAQTRGLFDTEGVALAGKKTE